MRGEHGLDAHRHAHTVDAPGRPATTMANARRPIARLTRYPVLVARGSSTRVISSSRHALSNARGKGLGVTPRPLCGRCRPLRLEGDEDEEQHEG